VPNKGNTEFFSILGIGRNIKELVRQKECLPLLKVKFFYAHGTVPPVLEIKHGGSFNELSVIESKDEWVEGSCINHTWVPDGGGSTGQGGVHNQPSEISLSPNFFLRDSVQH
jgi:hypothetical protein